MYPDDALRLDLIRLSRFASSHYVSRPCRASIRGMWSAEETRILLAMRREGIQRKVIARVLDRSPKSIKNRLERVG